MPMDMTVMDDGRVLYIKASYPLTSIEIRTITQQSSTYLEQSPYTVNTVVDVRELKSLSPEAMKIDSYRGMKHPKQGVVAMVGANNTLRAIANALVGALGLSTMRFFATDEEAFAWVRAAISEQQQKLAS